MSRNKALIRQGLLQKAEGLFNCSPPAAAFMIGLCPNGAVQLA